MRLVDVLPPLNASLNGASAVCIFIAWRAIRAGRRDLHRRFMLAAVTCSVVFLASYLTRFALTGAHRYPAHDLTRPLYLGILISHTLLAASTPVLVGRALWLALRGRFDAHKRIVRWTLPIWSYVSVTGVVIYLMLYQLGPARARAEALADCSGSLTGVWRDATAARAFDIRDDGAHVWAYPMWDSSRPDDGDKAPLLTDPAAPPPALVLSPWRLELTRGGAHVVGTLRYRITQLGKTCDISQPAHLADCHDRQATLVVATAAAVDATTCSLPLPPRRIEYHLERD